MAQSTRRGEPPERRRFLRESLTGSVPLLVDWVAGRARQLARLLQEPTPPRPLSPPPAAAASAPEPTKKTLDEHYTEFARQNPDADSYAPAGSPRANERAK